MDFFARERPASQTTNETTVLTKIELAGVIYGDRSRQPDSGYIMYVIELAVRGSCYFVHD